MPVYYSASDYVAEAESYQEKITRIDNVISVMESTLLKAAETGHISEYSLDDTQTKIKTVYRSPDEVLKSIRALESLKTLYKNRINGRTIRLVDSKNFPNGY
jgi:hypothetical protein